MAYPFVVALVVFPAESNASVTSLTDSGWSLISTIPPALSAMGPNTSIVKDVRRRAQHPHRRDGGAE